jgi:hypothetical protein
MQYSAALRNATLDAIETTVGTAPVLRTYNGTIPATPDTALSGNTLLAQGTLPSDWLAAASGGTKAKSGTWTLTGQSGASTGTAQTFYRLFRSDGTTCDIQGPISELGLDNNNVANSQVITINTAVFTAGNA